MGVVKLNPVEEIGKKYGRYTVIEFAGKSKNGIVRVKCLCDCGNQKIVRLCSLKKGEIRSCGCLAKELLVERNKTIKYTTHAKSRTRLYTIWCDMKQRCLNKNSVVFRYYGGRNISICKEWENDFNKFYDWAQKNGYSDNLTIDRIDVNGNYEPSNCRWITIQMQRKNTRNNIFVEIEGETKILKDWCDYYNITYTTVMSRLKLGWNIEKALKTPARKHKEYNYAKSCYDCNKTSLG